MAADWYTREELLGLGLGAFGEDVLIDPGAKLLNPSRIFIGSHVRIDSFVFIGAGAGGVHIGDHVHLAVGACIFGGGGRVDLESFTGLAARAEIYTANDDYTGECLTNPTVPDEFKNVARGDVVLRRHALVGTGSVIMPGVVVGVGAAVGALSFVGRSVPDFAVVAGHPARRIGKRHDGMLALEQELLAREGRRQD
jgi:dTDP-4-amino-4,6-dideoxy-D-glucose acyltransferase